MNASVSMSPTRSAVTPSIWLVFLAALGPMLTVSSLRVLLVEKHGASPASVHVFVALGMLGGAIAAPIVAQRADARGDHLRIAAILAAVDALVQSVTPSLPATWLMHFLRPIHGGASMALLALLLGRVKDPAARLVSRGGAAAVLALAIGPALGGAMGRHDPALPFRAAAVLSALVACILAVRSSGQPVARRFIGSTPARERVPMGPLVRSTFGPLAMAFAQRFAIGGFVVAFAARARTVHQLGAASVGACFSLFLITFAIGTLAVGRRVQAEPRMSRAMVVTGASLFAGSFVALAVAPLFLVFPALAVGGVGSALVHAPSLAAIAARGERSRTSAVALFHAAGALGMVVGPFAGGLIELALHSAPSGARAAAFLLLGAVFQLAVAMTARHRFSGANDSAPGSQPSLDQRTS